MQSKKVMLLWICLACCLVGITQSVNNSKPSDPSLSRGKGTLSFKINGQLFRSSPEHTKCWTSKNVSLAILWSKGDQMSVTWQLQQVKGQGIYRLDRDSIGTVNFTVQGKTYWIRKPAAGNYLAITITGIREIYNVRLLSGTFEGVLEDKDGNKVRISEGKFTSEDI